MRGCILAALAGALVVLAGAAGAGADPMAEPAHTTSTEHAPAGEHGGGFPPFVITSYSIHYTKLYEHRLIAALFTTRCRIFLTRTG